MRRYFILSLLALLAIIGAACGGRPSEPTSTPTLEPTATSALIPTPTATITLMSPPPTPTPTPTPMPPTPTPPPTASPTPTPTPTPPPTASPTPTPTPTPPPTATPTPTSVPPGLSRDDPAPPGTTVMTHNGLALTVVSVNPDAWPVVRAENAFNDPPPSGFRDVIVRLRVQNVSGNITKETSISESDFKFVGSSAVIFEPFDESCGVIPDELDSDLFSGGVVEGNVCIQIPEEEADLLIFFEPLLCFCSQDRRWMWVEQPETIPPALDISTTVPLDESVSVGIARTNPTPADSAVMTDTGLAVSVVSITRDAWPIVYAENLFNDPPKEGRRFLLITLSVKNFSGGAEEVAVGDADFRMVGSEAHLLTTFQHGCGVIPDELGVSLFEGGDTTGNVCFEVGRNERDFILVYEPLFSFDESSRRWLDLGSAAD